MLTFREHLNELFNDHYEFSWVKKTKDKWAGKFETPLGPVKLLIMKYSGSPGMYEIIFLVRGNIHITNKADHGEQFKILGTVMAMIKDFVQLVKPESLYFTAKESSRVSLYNTLMKLAKRELKAKSAEQIHAFANDEGQAYLITL